MRRTACAAVISLLAVTLTGCGLAASVQDAVVGRTCTLVGLSEGISVDLTAVLPLEGEYRVALTLPGSGLSSEATLAGNTESGRLVGTSVDLDDDPVEVRVQARDSSGSVVYRGAGTAVPELDQPNGPRCDPENYWLSLRATDAGELLPWPRFEPVPDAQGRVPMWVYTRCGVLWLDEPYGDGGSWVRVDGVLDDGAGGPPPGWGVPVQSGWVAISGDRLTFEDERGHREVFRPATDADQFMQCVQ